MFASARFKGDLQCGGLPNLETLPDVPTWLSGEVCLLCRTYCTGLTNAASWLTSCSAGYQPLGEVAAGHAAARHDGRHVDIALGHDLLSAHRVALAARGETLSRRKGSNISFPFPFNWFGLLVRRLRAYFAIQSQRWLNSANHQSKSPTKGSLKFSWGW